MQLNDKNTLLSPLELAASHPHTSMTMQDVYRNSGIENALCVKDKMKEYSVIYTD
jgi:hypothetical protein